MSRFAAAALLTALAVAAPSCVTLGRHELLEKRVEELEVDRKRLEASLAEDVKRLETLHQQLQEAEQTLRKHGANLGLRMERVEADAQKMRGDLDAVQYHLGRVRDDLEAIRRALAEKVGVTAVLLPRDLPKDANGMWGEAQKRKTQGDLLVARAIFEAFETTYPKDKRAPQALMEIAALHEREGDVQRAIKAYANIESRYPGVSEVPESILRIAELVEKKQKDCKKARSIYQYLASNYKDSKQAKVAEERAKALRKTCR